MRKVAYFSFSLDHVVIFTYAITSPTAIFSLLAPYFRSQLLYIELYANVHFLMETQLFIDYSYINNLIFAKSPPPQFGKMPSPMSMFLSNCAILSANLTFFWLIINAILRSFLLYFIIFPYYYRVLFWLFGPMRTVFLIYPFLGKRVSMRFLALIASYYQLYFRFFLPIISVFLIVLVENGENVQTQTYHRSKNSKKYSTMKSQNTGIYQNTSQNHTY